MSGLFYGFKAYSQINADAACNAAQQTDIDKLKTTINTVSTQLTDIKTELDSPYFGLGAISRKLDRHIEGSK
jgi:hypothetical protein